MQVGCLLVILLRVYISKFSEMSSDTLRKYFVHNNPISFAGQFRGNELWL